MIFHGAQNLCFCHSLKLGHENVRRLPFRLLIFAISNSGIVLVNFLWLYNRDKRLANLENEIGCLAFAQNIIVIKTRFEKRERRFVDKFLVQGYNLLFEGDIAVYVVLASCCLRTCCPQFCHRVLQYTFVLAQHAVLCAILQCS